MRSTLIGIFEKRPDAERARSELLRAGFADDEVDLRTGIDDRAWRAPDDPRNHDDQTESSIGETVADWFRSLFGVDDDDDVDIYTEAMRRGDSVVTVRTGDGDRLDRASDILDACGSIDIDQQAHDWQAEGWERASATSGARAGETRKSAVRDERSRVGKRIVGRRRLRVYTHTVDEPAQEKHR